MIRVIDEGEHGAFFLYDPARVPRHPGVKFVEIGCFTLRRCDFLTRKHPQARYCAVEPDPDNYRKLCAEIEARKHCPECARLQSRTSICAHRVEPHNFALAQSDGECLLWQYGHEQLSSTFPRHRAEGMRVAATHKVQGRTLKSLLDALEVQTCDLLLLNCEGAEILALEQLAEDAALRGRVTQISCGAHYSHVHIYRESRWTAACAKLAPYYDITPADHLTLPYFHFGRKS